MTSKSAKGSDPLRNLRQIGTSPVCWTWVGIVAVIQCLLWKAGGPSGEPGSTWLSVYGLSRDAFLAGKFWQIFTYALFHGNWFHLAINAAFLLIIGSRVEYIAGKKAVWLTITSGIVAGGLFHLLLSPQGTSSHVLVGLSGGCIALLLLLTTLSPESRMMPIPVSGRSLGLGILTAELLLALADPAWNLPLISTMGRWLAEHGMASWFQLGHACHFGGGLAGWLVGRWMLRPRISLDSLRRDRAKREARSSPPRSLGG